MKAKLSLLSDLNSTSLLMDKAKITPSNLDVKQAVITSKQTINDTFVVKIPNREYLTAKVTEPPYKAFVEGFSFPLAILRAV